MHYRAVPVWPKGAAPGGGVRVAPGFWPGLVRILWRTGVVQGDADAGLAQEWPRESDASAKEAQVGGPGRVTPRKGRWRS